MFDVLHEWSSRPSSKHRRATNDARLPGTSLVQFPDANDLDRPDPEIIPAGFADARLCRAIGGGGATAHSSQTSRGKKIAGCAA
jgi:hypothetical protein